MKVYRIALRGLGPYRYPDLFETFAHHANNPRTPEPKRDGMGEIVNVCFPGCDVYQLKFAFKNLPALYRWFDAQDIEALRNHNFNLEVFEAPRIVAGRSGQCMFLPEESHKLFSTKIPPTLDTARKRVKIKKYPAQC